MVRALKGSKFRILLEKGDQDDIDEFAKQVNDLAPKYPELDWAVIKNGWIQVYIREDHPKWNEFYSDSIIFSLFESKSQQSSLRNIEYKGHNFNIKNNFFFMSKKEIMDLADKYNYDYTYNDAKVSEERYVYKLLSTMELSEEAKNVLEQAKKLVIKTFECLRDASRYITENTNYKGKNKTNRAK